MKPAHIKERREKEVRRILNRQSEIVIKRRELGYVKLEKPVRHGWFKELVLTYNLERYKHKEQIAEVVEKLERSYWGRTKEEASLKWGKQTSKHLIYRDIPTLSRRQFNKLSAKAQNLCTPYHYYNARKKLRIRFYINIPKGAYKIKFSRAYLTHSKRIDPALESEDALLDQKLIKRGYYQEYAKLNTWSNNWWLQLERKTREKKIGNQLKELTKYSVKEIINEEILWGKN